MEGQESKGGGGGEWGMKKKQLSFPSSHGPTGLFHPSITERSFTDPAGGKTPSEEKGVAKERRKEWTGG